MRRSPLRHPLAILRTTLGLTQKELADMVNRAARTIQSVELGKLPLSEELALALAEATGVEAGWLLEGQPEAPPRKGLTARHMAPEPGPYTREDYEMHRAFMESPVASLPEYQAELKEASTTYKGPGMDTVAISIPTAKRALLAAKQQMHQQADRQTIQALQQLLDKTILARTGDLVRWKLRRFVQTLAEESGVKLNWGPLVQVPWTHIHVADKAEPRTPPLAKKRLPGSKRR